jgi:hypothetical protein
VDSRKNPALIKILHNPLKMGHFREPTASVFLATKMAFRRQNPALISKPKNPRKPHEIKPGE